MLSRKSVSSVVLWGHNSQSHQTVYPFVPMVISQFGDKQSMTVGKELNWDLSLLLMTPNLPPPWSTSITKVSVKTGKKNMVELIYSLNALMNNNLPLGALLLCTIIWLLSLPSVTSNAVAESSSSV